MLNYIVDFSYSENYNLALKNLVNFESNFNFESLTKNSVVVIRTNLNKSDLGKILLVPSGQILLQKRKNRDLLEIVLGEYRQDSEDSLLDFFESLKFSSNQKLQKDENLITYFETLKEPSLSASFEQKSFENFNSDTLDELSRVEFDIIKEQISLDTDDYISMESLDTKIEVSDPPKDEKKVLSTELLRLDSKTAVPKWHTSTDPKINIELVERFIGDLKRAKELNLFASDELLIFSSLVNSSKTNMFEEMTPDTSKNLDEFIKYLRSAYGSTLLDMRQSLMTLKQAENESLFSFLSRVINLYYRSRDKETPTIDEIATDQVSKADIVHIFLQGLFNPEVQTNLRMRLSTIDFKDLTKVAREIEQALPVRPSINLAQSLVDSGLSEKINDLEKSMEKMVLHLNKRLSRSRTPRRYVRFDSRSRDSSGNRGYSRDRKFSKSKNTRYQGAGRSNWLKRDRSDSRGRNQSTKKSWRDLPQANFRCFNCGKYGHLKRWCKQPAKPSAR